jgi:hypoxanthine phosphoribosyltransferase
MRDPKKIYLNHDDLDKLYLKVLQQMAHVNYRPDVIIAPMRGGADMGVKFSNWFGVPVYAIHWQTRDGNEQHRDYLKKICESYPDPETKILLVDDILDSGKTLDDILEFIYEIRGVGDYDIAVAIENLEADETLSATYSGWEISRSETPEWIVFPWEEFL